MDSLTARPDLAELYDFIARIKEYPVSVSQLVSLARRARAPKMVIDFYKSFGDSQIFINREDLLSRSEQVGILRQIERDMPRDDLNVPQED